MKQRAMKYTSINSTAIVMINNTKNEQSISWGMFLKKLVSGDS